MRVLNFGSLNIDYVYQVDHFVQPGETMSAASLRISCGGKGLNQSVALARAGVGALSLIDFDKVDLSNLNRQQYKASQIGRKKPLALAENLKEINPYLGLECHTLRLTPENIPAVLQGADVICEAFDKAARVLGLPYAEVDRLSKMIPADPKMTLQKALDISTELKKAYDTDDKVHELIDIARTLEGIVGEMVSLRAFSFSTHSPLVLARTFFVLGRPFSS